MPTLIELTRPLERFLITPRRGPGVCRVCLNLTTGWDRCWACAHGGRSLDAVVPISYSVSDGALHRLLTDYKRIRAAPARESELTLAAVLWRYLVRHEGCIGRAAGVQRFDIVATVPSGVQDRDEAHPLRRVVAELTGPTRARHRRLLLRSHVDVAPHEFHPHRYDVSAVLAGRSVLLIDDTWTTGANAQSAGAALKRAGAGRVAAVVIGRYLNHDWRLNRLRLEAMPRAFAWERCALD